MIHPILDTQTLGFQWATMDPFLFCVHHDDGYPAGNEKLGPAASLAGRQIGQDFAGKDGWRMYHGDVVPGFPQHPHRGFETVTIVRKGLVDHSDSLGAAARYGQGDVQWLTAGHGIVHAEMFPLLDSKQPNRLELFQLWLNLPGSEKLVDPYFSMMWSHSIPKRRFVDAKGRGTMVVSIAGSVEGLTPLPPPPSSFASRKSSEVAIWTIQMDASATWTLPKASPGLNRMLYFFDGDKLRVAGQPVGARTGMSLRSELPVALVNESTRPCELLLLQGRPIGEPVVQYGPFVMSTRAEIQKAFEDYRRTGFGGWPWPSDDPVHGTSPSRFARHADGRVEYAEGPPTQPKVEARPSK